MTKLAQFFATTLLILSISAVTLADGGNTQGPTIAPPPPPPAEGSIAPSEPATYSPEPGSSVDIPTEFAVLVALLTQAIL